MNCSPPGSSVHGISQARTLEWFSISSSRGSSRPRDQTHVSCKSPALQVSSLHTDPLGKPHSDIKVTALQIFTVLPMSPHCVMSLLFSLTLKKKKKKNTEILFCISQHHRWWSRKWGKLICPSNGNPNVKQLPNSKANFNKFENCCLPVCPVLYYSECSFVCPGSVSKLWPV